MAHNENPIFVACIPFFNSCNPLSIASVTARLDMVAPVMAST